MLRAGLIRKLASGLYSWLPLGMRVVRKVETIVRAEMQRIGAQEIVMPGVQPAELWQETERWDAYGAALLKLRDRHDRNFCLGPTHEEVVTDLLRREVKSYRQLPLNFFQIQTKFRDEVRPRFGVMRAREFIMKDGYSFHADAASLRAIYHDYEQAYHAIFRRLGLRYCAVAADSGEMGGKESMEFHALAQSGEDALAINESGSFAANVELAEAVVTPVGTVNALPYTKVATPNCGTIADVCALLNQHPTESVKVMVFHGADYANNPKDLVAVVLRGDHRFNEVKLAKHPFIAGPCTMASDSDLAHVGLVKGYIGPLSLKIKVLCDTSAEVLVNFTCGANEAGFHCTNVNWQRDAHYDAVADVRMVEAGDASPNGDGVLHIERGIELGHIFQLGDTYAAKMGAVVTNSEEQTVPMQMGCYGIGITRIVAASIEQHHDDKGINWPLAIAPFHVVVIALDYHDPRIQQLADTLEASIEHHGLDVLLDDRNIRPGVKFADYELIGIPHQLVIGKKSLERGEVEYVDRAKGIKKALKADVQICTEFLCQQCQ